jgi:hypothetical protein
VKHESGLVFRLGGGLARSKSRKSSQHRKRGVTILVLVVDLVVIGGQIIAGLVVGRSARQPGRGQTGAAASGSMTHIWKPTIEGFVEEATGPVYLTTIQRVEASTDGFSIPFFKLFISVTAKNEQENVIEYRCLVGSCMAQVQDDVQQVWEKAQGVEAAVRASLSVCDVRPGCISDEPILGAPPIVLLLQ